MSSIETDDGGCEIDYVEEIPCGSVVAQSDGAIVLVFGKEMLSSLVAPDRLLRLIPHFVPAACWLARTMVKSIMAYSLS